jgi:hypothetical protein
MSFDWLPLLRALTENVPSWLLWKHKGQRTYGNWQGDFDSAGSPSAFGIVEELFVEELRQQNRGGVLIRCDHVPSAALFCHLAGESTLLEELDVAARMSFRGAPVFAYDSVAGFAEIDDEGVRRLSGPATAWMTLVLKHLGPTGRIRPSAWSMPERAWAEECPEDFVDAAAGVTSEVLSPHARRLAHAFLSGSGHGAGERFVVAATVQGVSRASRLRTRLSARVHIRSCPTLRAVTHEKRSVTRPATFLQLAAATDTVRHLQ